MKRYFKETIKLINQSFTKYGNRQYMISEPITQKQHAYQTYLAMKNTPIGSRIPELRVSALLHDIGHFCDDTPIDPIKGKDDQHEIKGGLWLVRRGFPALTYTPVFNHVKVKRYLCFKDKNYYDLLSKGSKLSLNLQGGPMNSEEARIFEKIPFFNESLLLRHCDEKGKDINLDNIEINFQELEDEILQVLYKEYYREYYEYYKYY
jgi:predicted HD phosphohydrolase